jgi:hypothetical protein
MKTPGVALLVVLLLVTGGALALMNNACKTCHHMVRSNNLTGPARKKRTQLILRCQ